MGKNRITCKTAVALVVDELGRLRPMGFVGRVYLGGVLWVETARFWSRKRAMNAALDKARAIVDDGPEAAFSTS